MKSVGGAERSIHLNNPDSPDDDRLIDSQSKLPDVLCCYARDASPCSGHFGLKQVTGTSVWGRGGRQRAGHVLVTVEQRGPADRWAGEPPCYTSDENTAHKRDRSTCRHTRTGNGNSTPGSLWPCGWDGSHDSTPEKLSCLPL